MAELIVLTFDDTEQAGEVLEALKDLQHEGQVKINDAAVIVKLESGKVEIKKRLDTGVKRGAIGGGLLGLLLAGLFFPVEASSSEPLAAALIGVLNYGVDDSSLRRVTESSNRMSAFCDGVRQPGRGQGSPDTVQRQRVSDNLIRRGGRNANRGAQVKLKEISNDLRSS
jgi:hypothetical protein